MRSYLYKIFMAIIAGSLIWMPAAVAGKLSPVSFTISIEKRMFSPQAQIRVSLYNETEKRKADATAGCTVTYDLKTKKEIEVCPQGVLNTKAQPQRFSFAVNDIKGSLQFVSSFVRLGELYQVTMAGLSSDNCNTTSATITGRIHSLDMHLKDFNWRQTQMACPDMHGGKDRRGDSGSALGPLKYHGKGEDPLWEFGEPLPDAAWKYAPGNKGDLKIIHSSPYNRPAIK